MIFQGQTSAETTTDPKGNFSISVPAGRYAVTAIARGFATLSFDSGEIVKDSRMDVVLEPADSPKLRTIGSVTVNGGFALARNVIPEANVSRSQMDARSPRG